LPAGCRWLGRWMRPRHGPSCCMGHWGAPVRWERKGGSYLLPPGLRKGTGGLSRSLDSPGRSPNRWEPPPAFSGPSEPASWPRTCKPAFIKKQKGRLAASPPWPPAAWPRQAVCGRPVGSKPVRIKGSGVGPRCGPSASRDPRDRDQHHSTGFPTATEARKIRSNGGGLYCGA
jgi:hypothetical protein